MIFNVRIGPNFNCARHNWILLQLLVQLAPNATCVSLGAFLVFCSRVGLVSILAPVAPNAVGLLNFYLLSPFL